jgi:hypothetical protein
MFLSQWGMVRRKKGTFIVSWKRKRTKESKTSWTNFEDGCSDQQTLERALDRLNHIKCGFVMDVGQGGSWHILRQDTQKLVAWSGWCFSKDAPIFEVFV